jgi:hypothetical protein
MIKLLVFSFLFKFAGATCPNLCSGHGTCGVDDMCTCYAGWGTAGQTGGDCSDRFCPYEIAWTDSPSEDGSTHKYAECANKGNCDRTIGECECFAGYEGKGCGRQACPGSCSGHGTCELMKDLTYGSVYSTYHDGSTLAKSGFGVGGKKFTDHSWESDRARACLCDGGWTGVSCDSRLCPMGTDIMNNIPSGLGNRNPQEQTITLIDHNENNANFTGQTFAMQFTTNLKETFTTQSIKWDASDPVLEGYIESALMKLPNKVIDLVSVTVNSSNGVSGVTIKIAFSGATVQGSQNPIEMLVNECSEGCTPLVTGLGNLRTYHSTTISRVEVSTNPSHVAHECGNRGKCDRKTGVCDCFVGFTGENCHKLAIAA